MPGSDFYVWQTRAQTVRVALDLIDDINAVLNDPRNTPEEECGGILLGRVREPRSIELCGFEPIRSEHHRGTIFGLGLREQRRVASRVGALAKRRSLRPIGFFRTHLRPGLYLDQDDFALMQEAFGDPSDIALLIRPVEPGPANAGIFLWEDGDIDRRQAAQIFSFNSTNLRLEGPIESEPGDPALFRPSKKGIRMPAIPKPVLGWSIAAVAGLALAIGGLGAAHWLTGKSPSDAGAHPLNLQMRKSGDAITIDWDRTATSLQSASSAVLTIRDGSEEQKLILNRGDLQHGNVQFWPRSKDVSVRMDVDGVKVDRPAPAPVEPLQTAAVILAPKTERRPAPPVPAPAALPHIETATDNNPVVAAEYSDEKPDAVSPPPVAATRPLTRALAATAPRVEREEGAAIGVPPNPVPVALTPGPRSRPLPDPPTVIRRAPKPAGVAVSVRLEHQNPREFRKMVSHLPLLGRSVRGDGGDSYSPARPVRPLEPRVPESLAGYVVGYVDVDIKVSLDKHGTVRNAEILSGQGSQLAGLAANSATSAMWEPAYDGDRPVASDVVVHYRFQSRD